jgi:hypothetical protein
MDAAEPIAPEVLHLMRQVVATAIATRRTGLAEAAAEARGVARGRHPALPAAAIDAAVDGILRELGAYRAPPPSTERPEHDGTPLLPVGPEEVADALAYAMRFDERGKARRTGVEYVSKLAAEQLVRHLLLCGFLVVRRGSAPEVPPQGGRQEG